MQHCITMVLFTCSAVLLHQITTHRQSHDWMQQLLSGHKEYIVIGWNFLGHWYLVETWAKKSKIGISLKFNLYLVETFLVFGWNPICISLKLFWLFVETQLVFRGIFFGISWNFFWYLVETFSGIMKAFSGMKLRWNRPILCPRRENTMGRG